MTERVTTRFETEQLERLDELVDDGEFPTRSHAIRAGVDLLVDRHQSRVIATDGGLATTPIYAHRDETEDDLMSDILFVSFERDELTETLTQDGADRNIEHVEHRVFSALDDAVEEATRGTLTDVEELLTPERFREVHDEEPPEVGTLTYSPETGAIMNIEPDPSALVAKCEFHGLADGETVEHSVGDPADAEWAVWCDDGCETLGLFDERHAAEEVADRHSEHTEHLVAPLRKHDERVAVTGGDSA